MPLGELALQLMDVVEWPPLADEQPPDSTHAGSSKDSTRTIAMGSKEYATRSSRAMGSKESATGSSWYPSKTSTMGSNECLVWAHPKHLSACSGDGGEPSVMRPEPLLLHDQLGPFCEALRKDLPTSARIAAGSAMWGADVLDDAPVDSDLAESVALMRQVQVLLDPTGGCLRLWPKIQCTDRWAVDVHLLGAEIAVSALDSEVGGYAIGVVPCATRTSLSLGRGLPATAAYENLSAVDEASIGTWVFVFDGDGTSLVSVLDTFSKCGAIRTGLDLSFELTDRALGSGGSATVYVARGIPSGKFSAIKLAREAGSQADRMLTHEIALLVATQGHPNIVRFRGLFRTDSLSGSSVPWHWAVAFDLCPGGDLQHRVSRSGPQAEEDVGPILRGALRALHHIHERGIVHRDVKSENIMLEERLFPVLVDFGVAAFVSDTQQMSCRCGSVGYAAPEVFRASQTYDSKVDVFGIGVTMYFLLSARLPFAGKDVAQALRRNMRGLVDLEKDQYLQQISPAAKEFLGALVQKEPQFRLSAGEASQSEWWKETFNTTDNVVRLGLVPIPPPPRSPDAPRCPPRRGSPLKTVQPKPSEPDSAGLSKRSRTQPPTSRDPPSPDHPEQGKFRVSKIAIAVAEAARRHSSASSGNAFALLPQQLGTEVPCTSTMSNAEEDGRKSVSFAKRLHGAIAAGMGLNRAPKFEVSLERGVRGNRKFRLLNFGDDGGSTTPGGSIATNVPLRGSARFDSGLSLFSGETEPDESGASGRATESSCVTPLRNGTLNGCSPPSNDSQKSDGGKNFGSATELLKRGGSDSSPTVPILRSVLPAVQVSAASALAEAGGSMDERSMPSTITDAKGKETNKGENPERANMITILGRRLSRLFNREEVADLGPMSR